LAATPEVLQRLFDLPASLGSVRIPRAHHAFVGANPRDRRTYLGTVTPMIASGAIAQEGQEPGSVRGYRDGVTQAEMAAKAGVHRVTISRRMSKLATPAKGWELARQRRRKALDQRRTAMMQLMLHDEGCDACAGRLPENVQNVEKENGDERIGDNDRAAGTDRRVRVLEDSRDVANSPAARCAAGAKLEKRANANVADLEHYHRASPTPVLTRRRRFGMASRYGIHMAQRREQLAVIEVSTRTAVKHFLKFDLAEAACERLNRDAAARGVVSADGAPRYIVDLVPLQETTVRAPSLAELRADPVAGAWWEPEGTLDAHGKPIYQAEGYKAIDQWIWDQRILNPETLNHPKPRSLSTLPRLLMSLYQSRGLMSEFAPSERFPEGKKSGFLRMHQAEAARLLGCSRRSIYRANCLWEKLGVLRIVAGNPRKTAGGWERGAQEVLYLPFRTLTDAECDAEAERMARRVREVCASQYARELWGSAGALKQAVKALELHRELLARWRGSERQLRTFYRAVAEACSAAGIFADFYTECLPPSRPPGGPPEPGWFDSPQAG
jgi:hypothetical protein